jgi:hypothetical protein
MTKSQREAIKSGKPCPAVLFLNDEYDPADENRAKPEKPPRDERMPGPPVTDAVLRKYHGKK